MTRLSRNSFVPRFVDDFFSKDILSGILEDRQTTLPSVNITEDNESFKINVAAPGLEKSDFKLSLDDNLLTVSCEKEVQTEETGESFVRREFNYSTFKRSFTLPEMVDADKISASHNNGILSVNLPKREAATEKSAKQIVIE